MRAVSPEAVLKAIDLIRKMCEDAEWREEGDGYPLDPENLYRHVGALLAGEDPPEPAPAAKIVAVCIEAFLGIEVGVGKDFAEAEATSRPMSSPETLEIAARWGAAFYRDYFGEDPTTGVESGWSDFTAVAKGLLSWRARLVAMHSALLS